jgi:hypothetical protein
MIVPTQAQRSGSVIANGFTYQVPLNPVAAGILAKYPMPSNPYGIYGANTFTEQFKQPLNVNQFPSVSIIASRRRTSSLAALRTSTTSRYGGIRGHDWT